MENYEHQAKCEFLLAGARLSRRQETAAVDIISSAPTPPTPGAHCHYRRQLRQLIRNHETWLDLPGFARCEPG
jgi:hypothetical protein